MKMRDVMTPPRWNITRDALLRTAEHVMARHRLRHLPVVEGGMIVGVLSERDVLAYRARTGGRPDWWMSPVATAMRTTFAAARPDDDLDIDEIFGEHEFLPIVDNGYLIGVVTASDVLESEVRASLPPLPRVDATAADAMTEHPWTCRPEDSLVDAAKLMVDYEVRHLPVVADGRLVGMLSDRDIRTVVGDPSHFAAVGDSWLTVRDAMTPDPVTVESNRRLQDIAVALVEDRVGALPVVDADGRLVGILSYIDALRTLAAA